jgi:hypothetical protein
MHMPSIDQLLSRVVERKGYIVQGADQEALFARKGEEALLAAWKLDGPLTAADAQMFLAACEQVRAASGVLVAVGGVDAAARDLLSANKSVDVWAESRLVMEVGEAWVKDALDAAPRPAAQGPPARLPATPGSSTNVPSGANAFQATREVAAGNKPSSKFPSLIAQAAGASVVSNAGAAYYMPNKRKEAPSDMQATIPQKAGGSLGYAWGGGAGGPVNSGIAQVRSGRHPKNGLQEGGTVGAAPAAMAPQSNYIVPGDDVEITTSPRRGASPAPAAPAARAPVPAETEAYEIITTKKPAAKEAVKAAAPSSGVLKVNMTKEEALAKAGAKAGSTVRLTLVPHVAFEYDLNMQRPGVQPITAKGALLLSSLTGELRPVDGLAYADAAPAEARREQEKLQAVDLYDKVKSYMSKTFSRTLNVEREVAGVSMTETMKLVPDPDECGLEHKGMVAVPVWEVVTSTGVTRVEAYTGNLLAS